MEEFNPEEFKNKLIEKVKIISGEDNLEVQRKYEAFKKAHNVIDKKQYDCKRMFVFYLVPEDINK